RGSRNISWPRTPFRTRPTRSPNCRRSGPFRRWRSTPAAATARAGGGAGAADRPGRHAALDKPGACGASERAPSRRHAGVSEADPIAGLLLKVAAADRGAFRALYSSAGGKLFAVALRILQDRTEAEDAVQEVFTRVWLNARRYDPGRAR